MDRTRVALVLVGLVALALGCSTTPPEVVAGDARSPSLEASAAPTAERQGMTSAELAAFFRAEPDRQRARTPKAMRLPVRAFAALGDDERNACAGARGEWRCEAAAASPVRAASGVRPPPFPASWKVPAWFADLGNSTGVASDNNACTTSAAPCLTLQEIYNGRMGCIGVGQEGCPNFPQSTTITIMSTSPSNGEADPFGFCPAWRGNAQIQVTGPVNATTQVSTGTITVTQALNRTANPGLDLQATFSGAAITGGVTLIQNSTHPSFATYYQLTPTINMPLTTTTTAASWPTEVTTWATADAYTAYVPAGVNLVRLCGRPIDPVTNPLIFNQLTILNSEPSHVTSTFQVVRVDGPVMVSDVITNRKVIVAADGGGYYPSPRFTDVMFNANGQFRGLAPTSAASGIVTNGNGGTSTPYSTMTQILGGSFYDQPDTGEVSFEHVYLDDDVRLEKGGIGALFAGVNLWGTVEIEGSGGFINNYGYIQMKSVIGNTPLMWGNASGNNYYGQGSSRLCTNGVATATAITASILLRLNARVATGCSHSNASPDVVTCGQNLTQANIDATQGTGTTPNIGFGGLAFLLGGGSITSALQ